MLSRQYKWAQNNQAKGLCRTCSKPVVETNGKKGSYCWLHGVLKNEYARRTKGITSPRFNSVYYRAMKEDIGEKLFNEAMQSKDLIKWIKDNVH